MPSFLVLRDLDMELISLNEEKPFYNIRKRNGAELARKVRDYWYHFNI